VSESFIPFRLTPDRLADLDAAMHPGSAPAAALNRDFAPVAYYFDVALWSSQFNQGYRRFFRAMAGVPWGAVLAAAAGLLAAVVAGGTLLTKRRQRRFAAGFSTAATGFTMIGLEMLLLLGFQAVYGYVYGQLALLIAAFMAGMALGSGLAIRRPVRGGLRRGLRVLATAQMLAAAAPLVLLGLFEAIGRAHGMGSLAASRIAFPALALGSGLLGGYQFPVASRIFFDAAPCGIPAAPRPGALYALDLAGSCLGAILFSAWFVPLFGFFRTAMLSALVSLAPAAMAVLAGSPTRRVE
jgi:hypothetical protein